MSDKPRQLSPLPSADDHSSSNSHHPVACLPCQPSPLLGLSATTWRTHRLPPRPPWPTRHSLSVSAVCLAPQLANQHACSNQLVQPWHAQGGRQLWSTVWDWSLPTPELHQMMPAQVWIGRAYTLLRGSAYPPLLLRVTHCT